MPSVHVEDHSECGTCSFEVYRTWDAPRMHGPIEDEDTYAQRVWEQMEQHRRRQQNPSQPSVGTATKEAWGKADAGWQQAKRAKLDREAEARDRSDRILEEERRRDAAWRQAVLQVLACLILTGACILCNGCTQQ